MSAPRSILSRVKGRLSRVIKKFWSNPKPASHTRRSLLFSSLTRVIFLSNMIGLAILIAGSMALNQYTAGLVEARVENLHSKAKLITSMLGDAATGSASRSNLNVEDARRVLSILDLPEGWRVRLHDKDARLVADSEAFQGDITVEPLDPISPTPLDTDAAQSENKSLGARLRTYTRNTPWQVQRRERLRRDLYADIKNALQGTSMGGERYNADDELIVTVSTPVQRVQEVVGVLTLESADVDDIIANERRALSPFIGLAIIAALLSSIALTMSLALPLRDLIRTAESVSKSSDKRQTIPDYSSRGDEIGDLSIVLRHMMDRLYARIDDIANFAADVAHEIKNPLTSLRSASDTLKLAKTKAQRDQLIAIIQNDVQRMDRLISDISNASRIDANIARETMKPINAVTVLTRMAELYGQIQSESGIKISFTPPDKNTHTSKNYIFQGFEGSFAQVLQNLIDNAITFSPKNGSVRLSLHDVTADKTHTKTSSFEIWVEDDGPGIPQDNFETIFERFYTERPKGTNFGSHSGLGLAICRQIMSAHKGQLRAENIGGPDTIKGARFIITLPRIRPE